MPFRLKRLFALIQGCFGSQPDVLQSPPDRNPSLFLSQASQALLLKGLRFSP